MATSECTVLSAHTSPANNGAVMEKYTKFGFRHDPLAVAILLLYTITTLY